MLAACSVAEDARTKLWRSKNQWKMYLQCPKHWNVTAELLWANKDVTELLWANKDVTELLWGNGEMERWRDGEMERWRNGEMERWKNGEMERWMDGEMDGCHWATMGKWTRMLLSYYEQDVTEFLWANGEISYEWYLYTKTPKQWRDVNGAKCLLNTVHKWTHHTNHLVLGGDHRVLGGYSLAIGGDSLVTILGSNSTAKSLILAFSEACCSFQFVMTDSIHPARFGFDV